MRINPILFFAALSIASASGITPMQAANNTLNPAKTDWKEVDFMQARKERQKTFDNKKAFNLFSQKAKATDTAEKPKGDGYGTITGPDGSTWLYTQTFELNPTDTYYYSKSVIKIYDSNSELKGTINVDVPEGKKVNAIQPYGTITNKFFDLDANTYEVAVSLHVIDYENGNSFIQEIYDLGGNKRFTYENARNLFYFDATEGFNNYTRYLKETTSVEDGKEYYNITVYKPCPWGKTEPEEEHTFKVASELLDYSEGAYINWYKIDGKPYYVLSHYEKPYVSGFDNSGEIIVTENNHYILEVYDKSFEKIHELSLPVLKSENALYGMCSFGAFSFDDMNKGLFSGDGKFNFIVNHFDYLASTDSYSNNFYVYDEDGELVQIIATGIDQWLTLNSIPNQPEQMALMRTVGDKQAIDMIDMPSCKIATTFPSELNGELLSTYFDRYPKNGSYQYVFSMGTAATDEEENVIARVGWYNPDLTLDHFAKFNLGKNAEYASAYIEQGVLDPYMFDTDDQHEYIVTSKIKNQIGQLDNYLMICKEDGTVYKRFPEEGNDTQIYSNGAVLNLGTKHDPKLMVVYSDKSTGEYSIDAMSLPFDKFNGEGDGTKEKPYKIHTPGDIRAIEKDHNAYYELANDIDMSNYLGYFKPVEKFDGNFDGKGYSINNLKLDGSNDYTGLFGYLESGSSVKNMSINNTTIDLSSSYTMSVGVLSGSMTKSTIDNVHVNNAKITADDSFSGSIGGISGDVSLKTQITSSSVNSLKIKAVEASNVGGIAGNTMTGTTVKASTANGEIEAGSTVGGILGAAGNDVEIHDCYADMKLKAKNTIGGIAGTSSRGLITNCFALGTITATEGFLGGKYNTGGIIGSIDSNWDETDKTIVLSNCVAAQSLIDVPEDAKAVHRIAGFTIADEEYAEGETPRTEAGFDNNHAISSLKIGKSTVTSADPKSPQGADTDKTDSDFFKELGYKFGTDASNPWKEAASTPILYFEKKATSIALDKTTENAEAGSSFELTATVEGADASKVAFSSSDESMAQILSVTVNGNKAVATVLYNGAGEVTITAEIDGLEAKCTIKDAGISDTNNDDSINLEYDGSRISAYGASRIDLYNMNGIHVAYADGETLETAALQKGIYIAVATKADGSRKVEKIAIR